MGEILRTDFWYILIRHYLDKTILNKTALRRTKLTNQQISPKPSKIIYVCKKLTQCVNVSKYTREAVTKLSKSYPNTYSIINNISTYVNGLRSKLNVWFWKERTSQNNDGRITKPSVSQGGNKLSFLLHSLSMTIPKDEMWNVHFGELGSYQ